MKNIIFAPVVKVPCKLLYIPATTWFPASIPDELNLKTALTLHGTV